MRYIYKYRTSANVICGGEISAPSRDAVYVALKAKGIRPSYVEEAPGFLNKFLGGGKRLVVIAAFSFVVILLSVLLHRIGASGNDGECSPMDRHQIYGEPVLMANLERESYESVFPDRGDRYLACFAQPGAVVRFDDGDWRRKMAESLKCLRSSGICFESGERREVRELKRIVLGMRDELSRYLANGVGTYDTFVRRLEERQDRERSIYLSAERDLSNERDPEVFEARNEQLRQLGIRTILQPEKDFPPAP